MNEVARIIGCSTGSVDRWKKARKKRGDQGLKAKLHPGPKARLNATQKRRLVSLLKKGAVAAGYEADLWTCRHVRDLIGQTFGIWYDFNHIGRILYSLSFSVQEPEARARRGGDRALAEEGMTYTAGKMLGRAQIVMMFYDS